MKSKYWLFFVLISVFAIGCSDRNLFSNKFISVPDNLLSFGNVAFGGEKTVQLLITNEKGGIVTITGAEITGEHSADFRIAAPSTVPSVSHPIVLTGKGSQVGMFIKVIPSIEGMLRAQIAIEYGGNKPLIVDLLATSLKPILRFAPEVIHFAMTMITDFSTAKITFTNPTVADLTIIDLSISGENSDEFSIISPIYKPSELAPMVIQGLGQAEITLAFEPEEIHPRNAFLDIISNDKGQPNALTQIPLVGIGLYELQTIETVPVEYDFARVDVGYFAEAQVHIWNWGVANLEITDATIALPFEITEIVDSHSVLVDLTAAPQIIEKGDYIVVTVRFTPQNLGIEMADLEITSDTDDVPATITSVPFSGVGGDENNPYLYPGIDPYVFEDTAVGDFVEVELRMYNYGTGSLIITDAMNTNWHIFDVVMARTSAGVPIFDFPFSIATNDYIILTVRFQPNAAGQLSSTFSIECNSGGVMGTIVNFVLTGNGV